MIMMISLMQPPPFRPTATRVVLNREHGDRFNDLIGAFQRQVNAAADRHVAVVVALPGWPRVVMVPNCASFEFFGFQIIHLTL